MGWSISSTVMALPCMMVRVGLLPALSYNRPPEKMTKGSLFKKNNKNAKNEKFSFGG